MKITRVVCSPSGSYAAPGVMVEKEFVPDDTFVQCESGKIGFGEDGLVLEQLGWELFEKEIIRYAIEGKAQVSLKKTIDGERTVVENARDLCIGKAYEGCVRFAISPDERIMGLGQHEDGILNYRNCTQHLYQNNMQIPMPVFVSTAGYAVLFDADCLMIYEEHDNVITMNFDAVEQISYYVIESKNLNDLIKGIRRITGKAVMLPRWAYGYVQSKEHYHTQQELLEVAAEFERRGIPVSCLVQDWQTWESGKWGDKHLDKSRYPKLSDAVQSLHEKGSAFMFSVWPNMNKGSVDNQEMMEAEKLFANLSTYDAFDEEARELYWKQCEREIFAGGTDAWWCDSTEPFTPDWGGAEKKTPAERYELAKGSLAKYMDARQANAYALYHAKGIHDNQKKSDSGRRIVNLTRSGYPSIQKYGAVLWSGDIMATWEVFRQQIVEGLQMCASGVPYWTLDIGAFFAGNYNDWKGWSGAKEGTQPWFWNGLFERGSADRGYCELYTRWLQYGTFLPMMRSHGMSTPREPWSFEHTDRKYYDTIVKYIRLRYRLIPYIYSLAYGVYSRDELMMKHPVFDYPKEERVAALTDEFLFGDFLVCPVTEALEYGPEDTPIGKELSRRVYLPAGDNWYDYESGELFEGGQELTAEAPIERMPLYIRAGSIVTVQDCPEGEQVDLYHDVRLESIGVDIYAGKNAEFTFYQDSGNGYEYQTKEAVTIQLSWDEQERELVIGKAEGMLSGELPYPKSWEISLFDKEHGRTAAIRRSIEYDGREIHISYK